MQPPVESFRILRSCISVAPVMLAWLQKDTSSVWISRRCTKSASVIVAWLQKIVVSLWIPRRCTKAASVTCQQLAMLSVWIPRRCLLKGGVRHGRLVTFPHVERKYLAQMNGGRVRDPLAPIHVHSVQPCTCVTSNRDEIRIDEIMYGTLTTHAT